jgi:hypothetical protein
MAEKDRWGHTMARALGDKLAAAIWTTMPQEVHHALSDRFVYRLPGQIHKAADAAHDQVLLDTFGKLSEAISAFPALQRRRTAAIVAL